MPYAANGQISRAPIEGGIEITEAQYQEALAGILQGWIVSIDGGFSVTEPEPEPEPETEPEPTFEDLQTRKKLEIERARDSAINAGFEYAFDGVADHVQTRARDRENILGLAVSAQNNPDSTFQFRAQSNSTYTLTATEVRALGEAAQQHISAQYEHSWNLKNQVDAALDEAGLEAIEW